MEATQKQNQAVLFGHPAGLFTLFFAEMWERFSYYGLRVLLVFYMIKGFLSYSDDNAYAVYGAFSALVYATPFIGGMLADRLLGARRAVVIGGLLMAAGYVTMTIENESAFFLALALLICGNGFFQPNISTIVGSLYPLGSPRRDGGFTIYYMGINLGAAIAPILCGYVGETHGWHYGFGLATVGVLVGVAVFVAPVRLTRGLILVSAFATAVAMVWLQNNPYLLAVNAVVALALVVAGVVAFIALGRGGLPAEAGASPGVETLQRKVLGVLRADRAVYVGIVVAVPVVALLVQRNTVAGSILAIFGALAFVSLIVEAARSDTIERERLYVVLILTFFSMFFWAFFEQAGTSVNNFTDRNVDRVIEDRHIEPSDVGKTLTLTLNQEQLGRANGEQVINLTSLGKARAGKKDRVQWVVGEEDVGMGVAGAEIPASVFQAANPIFILIFGLIFIALWGFLSARGVEPSTPVKFAFGLLQLGLGFGAFWYGAQAADDRGMVWLGWLLLGYFLHTMGELCLSPVGLSMVTKLSPKRIVGTVMGAWFLATAFSNFLASLIAQLTGVSHGGDGGQVIPVPSETVGVYGRVFGTIAITAMGSALICFALSPLLQRWMHEEVDQSAPPAQAQGKSQLVSND
ncbi:MAG: peptide MFS transporter [Proteobacteria bacterium]|nr:peptide MFS transporter [Pseudomonadota bacterium]